MNSLIWTENDRRVSNGEILNEFWEKPDFNFEFDDLIYEPATQVAFRVLGEETLRLTTSQQKQCEKFVDDYPLSLDYEIPDRYKVVEEEEQPIDAATRANISLENQIQSGIRDVYQVGPMENLTNHETALSRKLLMSIIILLDLSDVVVDGINKDKAKSIISESIKNNNKIVKTLKVAKEVLERANSGNDFNFQKR